MVTIQLTDGNLDVGSEQAMELEVTAMRFSNGIRDAYTNDIDLPKTRNNIRLLECYNLLDSPNQLYGNQIKPAILTVDGYMLDVHLQVVSVTDDTITVCMYEQVLPNDLRDRAIRELIRDNESTIKVWWGESQTYWPDYFRQYDYGFTYNPALAQLHPVKGANNVISQIEAASGHTLPHVPDDMALMAQNRYVCPENTRQTISVQRLNGSNTGEMCMVAGQHVVNDAEGFENGKYEESSYKKMTFNRDCTATVTPYISWGRKLASGTHTFQIIAYINGVNCGGYTFNIHTANKRNGFVFPDPDTYTFHAGDVLEFRLSSSGLDNPFSKLEHLQMIWDVVYSDYAITEDDYGQEMKYAPKLPTLYGWCPNYPDYVWEYPFNGLGLQRLYIYKSETFYDPDDDIYLNFPLRGWAYHGYWCNLSDITVGQLIWGLAWIRGNGVTRNQTGLAWTASDRAKAIEGHITSISPSTEHLGQRNYIRWSGQQDTEPLTTIQNEFLEADHTIAELPFAYVTYGSEGLALVPQYTAKTNEDGTTDVDYDEIDGQVLVLYRDNEHTYLYPALIPPSMTNTFGFERLTSATEVEIETFDDQVTDLDYVYLDGRKYMIISVSCDLNDRLSRITALLVPTKSPLTPILWQLQRQ